MQIAVIVPTIPDTREEQYQAFLEAWTPLFNKHKVRLYTVYDGVSPYVTESENDTTRDIVDIMGVEYADLIFNFNDGVRNLGFAAAYKDGADILISLDDDVLPVRDTIQDHLDALNSRQPTSWMNTVDDIYMRGFPEWAKNESQVVFSHGLWQGVYDFDGDTQIQLELESAVLPEPRHRRMPIPSGVVIPVCVMNVAFHRSVLKAYYQAPMFGAVNRFADIWSGIVVKQEIDSRGLSMVNGYAVVKHMRASNSRVNQKKERVGKRMHEEMTFAYDSFDEPKYKGYRDLYKNNQRKWAEYLEKVS